MAKCQVHGTKFTFNGSEVPCIITPFTTVESRSCTCIDKCNEDHCEILITIESTRA